MTVPNYPKKELRNHLESLSREVIKPFYEGIDEEDLVLPNDKYEHVYSFIPKYDVDYPFLVIGEIFEKSYNSSSRTLVTENVIIHLFNTEDAIKQTEDIAYLLTKAINENLVSGEFKWSLDTTGDYSAESVFEYDQTKDMFLSHVVINLNFKIL